MATTANVFLWPVPSDTAPVDTRLRSGIGFSPTFSVDWTTTSSIPASITFSRASAANYYNSSGVLTSATTGTARIEYNPATLAQQGLLLEAQRTNSLKSSGDQTAGEWAAGGSVTRTTSGTLAPDGTSFMTQLAAPSGVHANGVEVFNNGSIATSTNVPSGLSVFVKKTNYNYAFISLSSDTSLCSVTVIVDLSTGAITQTATGATSGTLTSSFIQNIGGSIYRIGFVGSFSPLTSYLSVGFAGAATGNTFDTFGNPVWTAAGTETLLVWGAQLEVGASNSQYIGTTSVAGVTRSADIVSSTDATLIAAKAWVIEVGELVASTAATLLGINTAIGLGATAGNALTTADGGTQTTANTGTWTSQNRGGLAWDSTPRVSIDLDGGTVVTAANTPSTPTTLYFGNTNNGASGFLNGHIRMMAAYAALSDPQLVVLTVVGAPFSGGGITYPFSLASGAYDLTGSVASTFITRSLAGVTGTYALTGTALATLTTRELPATTGTYALSGQTATTFVTRKLAAVTGAYSLTGASAATFVTRKLSAVTGTYALTGSAATTFATRKLSAATGAYAFTGSTATLIRKYVLSETSGSYALTGHTATLRIQLSMTAVSGSYFLTGSSAPLKLTIKLPLTSGVYSLTGSTAATFATRKLSASTGSYALTGKTATTVVTRRLAAVSGAYALTGSAAQAFATRKLAAVSGIYIINGHAATLVLTAGSYTLAADSGSYGITGSSATLVATFITPTGDIYTVSGGQVVDHLPLQDGVEVVRAVSFPGSTTQRQTAD